MRYVWLAAALVCGGCNALLGIEELSVGDGDAGTDGSPDGVQTQCYGSLFQLCFPGPPAGEETLGGTFDTSADGRCEPRTQPNGVEVCAVYASSFSIATGGVAVRGSRPLVLVATGSIVVANPIEAGSAAGRAGPGANPGNNLCLPLGPGEDSGNDGGGGGAGGTFGSVGAAGGVGSDTGGNGANPVGVLQQLVGLRGGCAGSAGGRGQGASQNDVGGGGDGGGAIYLVASTISITARINASGAGGGGADDDHSGGGGGGSGGMIALEAMTISLDGPGGELFANGGGGGEGSHDTAAARGGESLGWNTAALGGNGNDNEGGDGGLGAIEGDGATMGAPGLGGNNNEGGGGGGGGGLGLIRLSVAPSGANSGQISPAYQPLL